MGKSVSWISGTTKVYGLLGRPVAHSLSPAMHNAAFRELGLDAVYVAFGVRDLAQAVAGIRGLDLGGVSVTIPFKESILPLLDELEPTAVRIGAVNTVVNRDGRLVGANTDWLGALRALEGKIDLSRAACLILGAGGAARAIAFALLEPGARVTVTDLDFSKAAALSRQLGVAAVSLEELDKVAAEVLVNATPVGMAPHIEAIPINPSLLDRFRVVMDIVYRPLWTRLLKEARERGLEIIDGLQMLVHQGAAQFELWTGRAAPVQVMARAAYLALEDAAPEV